MMSSPSIGQSDPDTSIGALEVGTQLEVGTPEQQVGSKRKRAFWAPKHIAYVKGVPFAATSEEYTNIFQECGDIISITQQKDEHDKWTGCLLIRFANEEGLRTAVSVWNGAIWTGKALYIALNIQISNVI